jgi:putative ABC transport system permease protein
MANGLIRMQTSAVVFGIDIDKAFEGPRPLLELPFQEGIFEAALEKLKSGGRYCLVPDSFAVRAGVHVGDKLELVLPPSEPGPVVPPRGAKKEKIIEYEICGVVSIHGWLWMNKISGVRKRGYRSGAMLIAPYETVKNDYRLTDAAYFWFDRTPGVSDTELEESLQNLADSLAPATVGVSRPMVKVNSRNYLRERVGSRAEQVIQAAAKMPLILLAISSFGMMGTIAASIRSRRFEFGVLRSLGLTRFGLIRLILAEALLIALTAIVVSVGFGVIAGWCFIGLMKYVGGFGGFTSPLTIPVYWLSMGLGGAIVFCLLSAIGPAVVAGRTTPTRLLQEG